MTKLTYTKKLGKLVANDAKGSSRKSVHVIITQPNTWSVINNGNIHASRSFKSKVSAVSYAKSRASEVIVHNNDGTIGSKYIVRKK